MGVRRCFRGEIQSVWLRNSIVSGVESVDFRIIAILHIHIIRKYEQVFILIPTRRNYTQQNKWEEVIESLQPLDNGICHAKLIEVHSSNMSWHLLLAKIFNSLISAGTYYGQHVTTFVSCDANQLVSQIGTRGRYATILNMVYLCVVQQKTLK